MEFLILLGMIYAACGLVISLVVHVMSIFGEMPGGQTLFFGLHMAIFPVFFFTAWIFAKPMKGATDKWAAWDFMLSGCPKWMRWMVMAFCFYAFVNFAIFFVLQFVLAQPVAAGAPPPDVWRGFSGHWMLFYAAALAGLTTAYNKGVDNLQRKCALGHTIGFEDNFCPVCGRETRRG